MKREGKQGAAELIKAIAASSTTFAGKTAFAQEKYLKKKAKKHMPFVALLRPSPLTLCDFYMLKSPDKLLGLRRDTLALLLTLSNVQEGSRVLVLEQTLGLLAAAATQAAGSSGRVLALSSLPNKPPILDAVPYLNLSAPAGAALKGAHLLDLLSLPPLRPPPPIRSKCRRRRQQQQQWRRGGRGRQQRRGRHVRGRHVRGGHGGSGEPGANRQASSYRRVRSGQGCR